MALAMDGGAVLMATGRNRQWGVASVGDVGREQGQLNLAFNQAQVVVSPWTRRSLSVVFWTEGRELVLMRWPGASEPTSLKPPGARRYRAIGLTREGGHVILAGSKHMLVVRSSDFRIQRMVQLDHHRGRAGAEVAPLGVVVDHAGGGGWGSALIVLYPGRFRAFRLEGVIQER